MFFIKPLRVSQKDAFSSPGGLSRIPINHHIPKEFPVPKHLFVDFNFPGAISFTYTFCNVQILPIHATSDFK